MLGALSDAQGRGQPTEQLGRQTGYQHHITTPSRVDHPCQCCAHAACLWWALCRNPVAACTALRCGAWLAQAMCEGCVAAGLLLARASGPRTLIPKSLPS